MIASAGRRRLSGTTNKRRGSCSTACLQLPSKRKPSKKRCCNFGLEEGRQWSTRGQDPGQPTMVRVCPVPASHYTCATLWGAACQACAACGAMCSWEGACWNMSVPSVLWWTSNHCVVRCALYIYSRAGLITWHVPLACIKPSTTLVLMMTGRLSSGRFTGLILRECAVQCVSGLIHPSCRWQH
jgi:hypothetical protein